MTRVYFYRAYERIWHWLQAILILGLLASGFEIHFPASLRVLGFARAITIHNALALMLVGNALLGLFYHLITGEIRQYLPQRGDFGPQAVAQAKYYLRGIFRREPHPFPRSPAQKLNPLQKLTYLLILNVLLPLQALSGAAMWMAQTWPSAGSLLGGLRTLAMIHTLLAWAFTAFLLMHMYLTTTGHTPLSHVRAMILGWDHVEESHVPQERSLRTAPSLRV